MASSEGIQGHDTIPQQIAERFKVIFRDHLPGWTKNGVYNFQATASTQLAAGQLGTLLQSGSHPWINNALDSMLRGSYFNALSDAEKTNHLAALVNFMKGKIRVR